MKTTTKLIALLLMLSVWLPDTALAQIPVPLNCNPPTVNGTIPDRTINFKMNGNNPLPPKPKDEMTGFIKAGSTVQVTFNIPKDAGRYSLVSYKFSPGTDLTDPSDDVFILYDFESLEFPIGNANMLKVLVPNCNYRVFFIRGCVLDPLNPINAYGGLEADDPINGNIIRLGGPDVQELALPLDVCPDLCPTATAETNHFQFRFIESYPVPNTTNTRLVFSVINKGKMSPAPVPYPEGNINPFLTGDVWFEGWPASALQVSQPVTNVPFFFRYNYQTANTASTLMPNPGGINRKVKFDQRNNHNNHAFSSFQSDIFIMDIPTASLATLDTVQICAELSDKQPEPGKTTGPFECAKVAITCEPVEEFCAVVETQNFRAEFLGLLNQVGTDAQGTIRIINKTASEVDFVQFADKDADFGELDVNILGATPIVYTTPFGVTSARTYNITSMLYPAGSTPTIAPFYDPSGLRATLNFDLTAGTYGLGDSETFNLSWTSRSFVLNGQTIKIYFKTVAGDLDSAVFEMGTCGEIVPLPVRLSRFDAKYVNGNKHVLVTWQTTMEENNQGFMIERSTDGKAFSEVGQVAGGPDGNTIRDYKFTDENPIRGLSFYRLKQTDFDGTVSYSKIAMVNSGKTKADLAINLAPNPCSNGDCEIKIANAQSSETTIELMDLTGRMIFRQTIAGQVETIRIPAKEVKGLKGVFLLRAESGGASASQRIILQ